MFGRPHKKNEKKSPGDLEAFGLLVSSRSLEDEAEHEAKRQQKIAAAGNAAKTIPAGKTYKLKRKDPSQPLRILTIGCHGKDNDNQRAVADAMAQFDENNPPDLVLFLGDNFYKKIDSADDNQFERFNEIYKKLIHKKIPFFMMLGNHDYGFENPTVKKLSGHYDKSETPQEIANYQIHQTYLNNPTRIKEIFLKDEIELSQLDNIWNLPAPYYALVDDHSKTRIICLDSNMYVSDYLKKDNIADGQNNQATWLKKQVEDAEKNGEKCIIALHHPVITPGKRAYDNKSDAEYYLSQSEINTIKTKFPDLKEKIPSYNKMLGEIFKEQKINSSLFLSAHDHMMFYGHDEVGQVKQVIAGGGGGKVQGQLSFLKQSAICLKQYGFIQLACEKNSPDIDIRIEAIEKSQNRPAHHLHYTTASIQPRYKDDAALIDNNKIKVFREAVIEGIKAYQLFLQKNQDANSGKFFDWFHNFSHGKEGVIRAQQLMAYLSEEKSDGYPKTVERVYYYLNESSHNKNSLLNFVNEQLKKRCEVASLDDLYLDRYKDSIKEIDISPGRLDIKSIRK